MNIMFLVSSLGAGGAERVAITLSNAWVKSGYQVTLLSTFSGGGDCFYETSKSVDLVFLSDLVGKRSKNILTYIQRFLILRKFIQKKKPDVIISFLPNVNVAAVLASSGLSIPVICSERTDPSVDNRTYFWRVVCRFIYPFADVIVVQTDSVAESIRQVFPNLKKVHKLANPLPEEVRLLGSGFIDKPRKILLSLGRLVPEKQIDKIIIAFAAIADKNPCWDLHIYGEGPSHNKLIQLVDFLKLSHRVFFMGATQKPWQVMSLADIFVMASVFEGFPNALLEAMGVGLPCVVFDCPSGPKEITRTGLDAFLVPLNDIETFSLRINELMQNDVLRLSMGKSAKKSVLERYALERVLGLWDCVFEEVGVS